MSKNSFEQFHLIKHNIKNSTRPKTGNMYSLTKI